MGPEQSHSGRTFHQEARPAVETAQVRLRLGITAGVAAFFMALGTGTAAAHEPWISEFNAGLTSGVGAWDIAAAKDGNLWFTQDALNNFARVTPTAVITDFPDALLGGGVRGIAGGPDGNIWIAEAGGNGAIARVSPAGEVTEFGFGLSPGDPWDITAGPDGNLWFVNRNPSIVGRITPEGVITEFTDGLTALSQPTAITAGPDGNLWFTETASGRIGRITTDGSITEFTSGLSGSGEPTDITSGPDGALWFTLNADPGGIGRITKTGAVTTFVDGLTANSRPVGIAKGPDGALWFTESASPGRIGRITTGGDVVEYTGGLTADVSPWFITPGPDGNMWFTENALLGRVARITLPPLVRGLSADDVGTTSAELRARVKPNAQATDYKFVYGQTDAYGRETEADYAGNGITMLNVSSDVGDLAPGTTYHFRVIATNDSGTSYGPDRTFETAAIVAQPSNVDPVPEPDPQPMPEPEFAKTIVADPVGTVRVKAPDGAWETMAPGTAMPVGATFDTRRGAVNVTTKGCRGHKQTGKFGGGLFTLRQPRRGCGRVDIYLRGGSFAGCGHVGTPGKGTHASAARVARVRRLWGRDRGGSFRTHGRHSQATVRGTRWLTVDRCDGTLTRVTNGSVAVRDYARHRVVLVRAGHSYLAKSRSAPRRGR
jgi:streptogramin lyase